MNKQNKDMENFIKYLKNDVILFSLFVFLVKNLNKITYLLVVILTIVFFSLFTRANFGYQMLFGICSLYLIVIGVSAIAQANDKNTTKYDYDLPFKSAKLVDKINEIINK